jgi:hypothetical protein
MEENSSTKSDKPNKKALRSVVKSEADSKSKSMKKYKKLIKTTYYNKLCENREDLEIRLSDKMNCDNLIRQIIVDLAIKLVYFILNTNRGNLSFTTESNGKF